MFDRVAYKNIAKKQLAGRWKTPILATLVVIGIVSILIIPEIRREGLTDVSEIFDELNPSDFFTLFSFNFNLDLTDIPTLITLAILGVLGIAYAKLFLELATSRDPLPFSTFLKGFSLYIQGILAMLWMTLWVVLWALLFFIPGIVKAYSYSQMLYILAENPDVGVRKSMRLSIEITRGYKGELFVLDLSFLLWYILSCIFFPAFLYFIPYYNMTKTNAYLMLKAMAIKSGRVSEADFGEPDGKADSSASEWANAGEQDGDFGSASTYGGDGSTSSSASKARSTGTSSFASDFSAASGKDGNMDTTHVKTEYTEANVSETSYSQNVIELNPPPEQTPDENGDDV